MRWALVVGLRGFPLLSHPPSLFSRPTLSYSCYLMIAAVVITVLSIIIAYFVNANSNAK